MQEDASFDFNAVGWRIFKFFSVEAGWVDFGSPEDTVGGTDVGVTADGLDLGAMAILPLGGHFELFAKGGHMAWDAEQIRAEYEQFEIEDADTVDRDSVSATFTF
jgi:hypothetical protein